MNENTVDHDKIEKILLTLKMVINAVTFRVGVCHEEMGLGVDLDIIAAYTTLCWFIS